MSGYDLDTFFPLKGTCFHCGRDLRHKTLDAINERFAAGEPISSLASDFNVPTQAIELVIGRNMAAPLGIGLALKPQAKSASA
ncbi:MAG: hypothetical protein M3209_19310 [Acidobacteriota bacterium]|nr:hypothetical protein [Acidobacteriota bacterium]